MSTDVNKFSEPTKGGAVCGRSPIGRTAPVGKGPVVDRWDGADPHLFGKPAAEDAGDLQDESAAGGEPNTGVSTRGEGRR